MRVTLRGTRGSLPTPGAQTNRYGGNTSCVELRSADGGIIILDAGTGIRQVEVDPEVCERVDVLLTHLHMDHILGLGFFGALFCPDLAVHIWGPASTTLDLRQRLSRYLSPPLFPVVLRDLPCHLELHDLPRGPFALPTADVTANLVCHPGPTAGIRISDGTGTMCYLPDHEPALGAHRFPDRWDWTSGIGLVAGVNLLIHDAQYTESEYQAHVGWGHSSLSHAIALAELGEVDQLVAFHHDPGHDDDFLDRHFARAAARQPASLRVTPAMEGALFAVGA